jgi:dihydroorotase
LAGKGRIAIGYDADITLVDLKAKRTITNDWIASKSGWTVYDGKSVAGWPIATVIRGQVVMQDDELVAQQIGAPVRFTESL